MTAQKKPINLLSLLRRLALYRAHSRAEFVLHAARSTMGPRRSEIIQCLEQFGPLVGLARLASLFAAPQVVMEMKPERIDALLWPDLLVFLRTLQAELPDLTHHRATALARSRLDHTLFSEIESQQRVARKEHNDDRVRDLDRIVSGLAPLYGVAPQLKQLSRLEQRMRDAELDLDGWIIIAHQHILGTVASQFESLWALGAKPVDTFVLGKSYSTNLLTALYLRGKGVTLATGFGRFRATSVSDPITYVQDQMDACRRLVYECREHLTSETRGIIVLDDGGLLAQALNESISDALTPGASALRQLVETGRVFAVEQTTFGKNYSLYFSSADRAPQERRQFSSVSVAESKLKLEIESEWIAESVVMETEAYLLASSDGAREPDGLEHPARLAGETVGVVGFGAVGSWVARYLSRLDDYSRPTSVIVYDLDKSKTTIARSYDYRVVDSIDDIIKNCSIVFGCTGAPTGVDFADRALRRFIVYVSATSGNYEFLQYANPRGSHLVVADVNPRYGRQTRESRFDRIHSIAKVEYRDSNITDVAPTGIAWILNSGFPVNFNGEVDPIDPSRIELTRCLMVAGVATGLSRLDASQALKSRLLTLDESWLSGSRWRR